MREGRYELSRLSLGLVSALLLASGVVAQDGTGRSESVDRPSAGRRTVHRESPRSNVPDRRIELGKLALTVNEGGSSVRITRLDSPDFSDVITVPSTSSSLIMRTLAAGNYRIAVSKPGYADETRDVEVTDGKQQRVSFLLKPNMAFLSVATGIPDARIEIEKVGVYTASASKLMLKPGRYRVNVSRRGYVSQTVSVDLNVPGGEENVRVLLKPHRIDDVLDEASENIAKGNYQMAGDLARDVLALNPEHARANLVFGMLELRRGGKDAGSFLLRAVRNGETLRMAVKMQEAQSNDMLDAELLVDRDRIAIKRPARSDLDLTIARADVTELRHFPQQEGGFIILNGKSSFHGRAINPNLRIHTRDVVADSTSGTTKCTNGNCARETAEIARFLRDWRSSK